MEGKIFPLRKKAASVMLRMALFKAFEREY